MVADRAPLIAQCIAALSNVALGDVSGEVGAHAQRLLEEALARLKQQLEAGLDAAAAIDPQLLAAFAKAVEATEGDGNSASAAALLVRLAAGAPREDAFTALRQVAQKARNSLARAQVLQHLAEAVAADRDDLSASRSLEVLKASALEDPSVIVRDQASHAIFRLVKGAPEEAAATRVEGLQALREIEAGARSEQERGIASTRLAELMQF